MSDRSWIKIHNGLTNDPKHRKQMGVRIWLFAWLVDHADWETGIVWEFTDKDCAAEMSDDSITVSGRTIEDQRQELEKSGYVVCHPGDQCQHIRIMRWRNPRMVNPPQINVPDDKATWYDVRRTPPRRKLRTPTLDSHIDHTPVAEKPNGNGKHPRQRDEIYEAVFYGLTGQEYMAGQSAHNGLASSITAECKKSGVTAEAVRAYYSDIRNKGLTPTTDKYKAAEGARRFMQGAAKPSKPIIIPVE